jgi:hypothetical protein
LSQLDVQQDQPADRSSRENLQREKSGHFDRHPWTNRGLHLVCLWPDYHRSSEDHFASKHFVHFGRSQMLGPKHLHVQHALLLLHHAQILSPFVSLNQQSRLARRKSPNQLDERLPGFPQRPLEKQQKFEIRFLEVSLPGPGQILRENTGDLCVFFND